MELTHRRFQAAVLVVTLVALTAPVVAAGVPNPASPSPDKGAKPLKVFILAGQSNMQGHASISTFDSPGRRPEDRAAAEGDARPGRQAAGVREGVDLVGRLPGRRLLGPARADGQADRRLRRVRRQGNDRPGVHLRPHDGEAAGRAGPHHQDGVGRAEPAHRFPPAQRRARMRQRLHPEAVEESGATTRRRKRPRRSKSDGRVLPRT